MELYFSDQENMRTFNVWGQTNTVSSMSCKTTTIHLFMVDKVYRSHSYVGDVGVQIPFLCWRCRSHSYVGDVGMQVPFLCW